MKRFFGSNKNNKKKSMEFFFFGGGGGRNQNKSVKKITLQYMICTFKLCRISFLSFTNELAGN